MDRKEGEFKVGDRVEIIGGPRDSQLGTVCSGRDSGPDRVFVNFSHDRYGRAEHVYFQPRFLRLVSAQCDDPKPLTAPGKTLDRLQIEADFNDDIPAGAQPEPLSVCELQAAVAPAAGIDATLAERGARYGQFIHHAVIAQDLQDAMRRASGWSKLAADQKQALSVIADKIARMLNGDPDYLDNWHDIIGYAKLVEDRLRAQAK